MTAAASASVPDSELANALRAAQEMKRMLVLAAAALVVAVFVCIAGWRLGRRFSWVIE